MRGRLRRSQFILGLAVVAVMSAGTGAAVAATGALSSSGTATPASPATSASSSLAGQPNTTPGSASSSDAGVSNWDAEGVVPSSLVLPGLSDATLLGSAPGTTMLTLAVGLAQPDSSAEVAAIDQMYDRTSPEYHHFLTPAQFDARFGVPTNTVDATEAWLRSGGLAIGYVSGAGDLVQARGTVSQVAALMKTTFGEYRVGDIGFLANQNAPELPAALPITAVAGLNTLERVWTEQEVDEANDTSFSTLVPKSLTTRSASSDSYDGTLVPQDLWGVYDAPSSDTGQGETAGMFGFGYPNGLFSDLRVWEQRMGLPAVPTRMVQESQLSPDATPNDNAVFADDEWNLDNEALSGMAPGLTQLDQYFASTPYDADMAVMFSDWAGDPDGPQQMNASFGECESFPDTPSQLNGVLNELNYGEALVGQEMEVLGDPALEQAVSEGRTLFSSAGDSGGSCPDVILPVIGWPNGLLPGTAPTDQNYPCASVWAVCVGGTVLTTNGTSNPSAAGEPQSDYTANPQRESEVSWAYTGGGPAGFIPEPSYQQNVANIDEPCTSPVAEDGSPITPGTICRGVPDVAAMSGIGIQGLDTANAFMTNIDMMPFAVGGTSLASPLTVGMWARIQAASPEVDGAYPGLGFANETFYAVGQSSSYSKDFYDITESEVPTGNFYQQSGPGWDYTSGWGAIDVAHMIADPKVDDDSSLTPTHPQQVSAPPPVVENCSAVMTSPEGNAYDTTLQPPVGSAPDDTALDITGSTVTVSGSNLVVTISGPGLSTTGPPDALDGYGFYAAWTYDGTTYFAGAAVDQPQDLDGVPAPVSLPTGTVTYGDGVMSSDSPTFTNTDTGSFTQNGTNGVFTIEVPLSDVGSPPVGSTLEYPFVFDLLPDGVFVPTAFDEAVSPPPGVDIVTEASPGVACPSTTQSAGGSGPSPIPVPLGGIGAGQGDPLGLGVQLGDDQLSLPFVGQLP